MTFQTNFILSNKVWREDAPWIILFVDVARPQQSHPRNVCLSNLSLHRLGPNGKDEAPNSQSRGLEPATKIPSPPPPTPSPPPLPYSVKWQIVKDLNLKEKKGVNYFDFSVPVDSLTCLLFQYMPLTSYSPYFSIYFIQCMHC